MKTRKICPTCRGSYKTIYKGQWRCLSCTRKWKNKQLKQLEAEAIEALEAPQGAPEPIAPGVVK